MQAICFSKAVDQSIEEEEIRAQVYLNELNDVLNERKNAESTAQWDYESNITDHNEKKQQEVSAANAEFYKV